MPPSEWGPPMPYKVLLPVDASRTRASAQATAVADLPALDDVAVTLLHVFEEGTADPDAVVDLDSVATARAVLDDTDATVDVRAAAGEPADEILAVAEDVAADSIVLGGRKRSALEGLLFGSVTQAVTLGADRPVWVTGATEALAGDPTAVAVPDSVTPETLATTGPFNVKFVTRNVFPEMDHEYSYHATYSYTDVEGYTHTVERRIYVYTDPERRDDGRPVAEVNEDHMVLTVPEEPHEIIEQTEREFVLDVEPNADEFAVRRACEAWHEEHLDVPDESGASGA
ncbi:MAG: universal stress protein [Halobacteriaceae archaeon]